MEVLVRRGTVIPSFTLPDTAGRLVRRTQFRGRRHLVLVFLPTLADDPAHSYLRALADAYAALHEAGGEVLAILAGGAVGGQAAEEMKLPFPLLTDVDGKVTARFVPPGGRAAVAVTDRYGELYYGLAATETATLPPVGELLDWLEAIDRQCAI